MLPGTSRSFWDTFYVKVERAAILIGVSRTGGLTRLRGVEDGIRKMTVWAESQGITGDRLVTITDAAQPVDVVTIKRAVKAFVDRSTIGQLIVYFAGHGVNIRRGEYWLLSDALEDANAAVNLDGSIMLARSCTIPHVVCISDACRTAAEGIQAQSVTGAEIFPNVTSEAPERSADLFFASTLGSPALEVRDVEESAGRYTALYTDVLSSALAGNIPDVVEWRIDGGDSAGYVRPRPLKRYLQSAVTRTLTLDGRTVSVSQTPDARITSDESAWVSRLSRPSGGEDLPSAPSAPEPPSAQGSEPQDAPSLFTISHELVHAAIQSMVEGETGPPVNFLALEGLGLGGRALTSAIARNIQSAGSAVADIRCGFFVHGQPLVRAVTSEGNAAILRDSIVPMDTMTRPGHTVLEFANGTVTVAAAIPGFVTVLSFDGNELDSVVYEPAAGSPRWQIVGALSGHVRSLRAVIASASQMGTFRLTGSEAQTLARTMQMLKGWDPALAIYAAYAYHEIGQRGRLHEMNRYLREDLGMTFFDVALLARTMDGTTARDRARDGVLPLFPALSQGWALLKACRVTLAPPLDGLERLLRSSSLWTLCDSAATPRLVDAVRGKW